MKTLSKLGRNGAQAPKFVGRTLINCLPPSVDGGKNVVVYNTLPKTAFSNDTDYNEYIHEFKSYYGIYSFY